MMKVLILIALIYKIKCQYGMRNKFYKDYAVRRPLPMTRISSAVMPYRGDYFIPRSVQMSMRRAPTLLRNKRVGKEDFQTTCTCVYVAAGAGGCRISIVGV